MTVAVELAQGLYHKGGFQRVAVVKPLDGFAELALLEAGGGFAGAPLVDGLLVRGVAGIGELTGLAQNDAAALSIGDRERLLFGLFRASFGPRVELGASCRACGEISELEVAAETAPPGPGEPAATHTAEYEADGRAWRITFRLPTGGDQAALAARQGADLEEAALLLVGRCVIKASCDGTEMVPEPDAPMLLAFETALRRADPAADGMLDFACASCGISNEVVIDAATILSDVLAGGGGILADVHRMASVYHWPEHDILALGTARRRHYLALIEAEASA